MLWRLLKTALVAAAFLCGSVAGHGFLMVPTSRVSDLTAAYTPTGVSAGGPDTVYMQGKLKFPNGNHGACGDDMTKPYPRMYEGGGQFYSMNGGFSMTYYPQGGSTTLQLYVSANHGGYWTFKVCPVPDSMASTSTIAENAIVNQQCFDAHQLQVTGTGGTGNAWFLDPGQNTPFTEKVTVVFPSSLTCKRCVLQWHWVTANSCIPPGFPPKYSGCQGCGACGGDAADPEEFWGCADIGIVPRNQPKPADTRARAYSLNMQGMMDMNGVKPDGVKGQVSGPAVGTIDGSGQHVYFPETGGGGMVPKDIILPSNTSTPSMPGMPGMPGMPSNPTDPSSATSAPGGSFPFPLGATLVGLVGGVLVGLPLMGASMVYAVVVGLITSAGTGLAFYFIRTHGHKVSQFIGFRHTRRKRRRSRRQTHSVSIEAAMSLPSPPRTRAIRHPMPPQPSTAFLESAREYARYMR